jgi:hypothetical protein
LRQYGDLDRYWTSYLELEREFAEFTNFVPLIMENRKVISPKLANLASLTGNWIETIFKKRMLRPWPFAATPLILPKDIKGVKEFRETFEEPYQLSKQVVFVKRYLTEYYRRVRPFGSFAEGKTPEWFSDYSGQKHNRPELQKRMTLWKTTEALAALFLLSVYPHEMREYLVDLGVIHKIKITANGVIEHDNDPTRHLKDFLMLHPSILPDRRASVVEPIIAETQMFSFEFPRQTMQRHLDSLWEQYGSKSPEERAEA